MYDMTEKGVRQSKRVERLLIGLYFFIPLMVYLGKILPSFFFEL
jgi:hypothetical protein